MSLKRIIHEVHRRSLWQVMLIYLGASWGVLQVVDQVQQRLSLPPWVYGVALIMLLVGLPIVLATAFVQEAPAAVAAEPAPGNAQRVLTWRNAIGGGLLAFIAGGAALVLWLNFSPTAHREAGDVGQRSIAVLPFANLSTDPGDAFFADGIQDEILTHLARIAALDVRSRTSMLEYKNTTKNLKQIAHELGVRFILEGSVRRAGEATRITAQLIDAHTDKHMWAETYDGTRSDVFGMQTSVAQKIASSLEAELSPAERSRLAQQPTDNADAHDLYLRALDYANRSQEANDFRTALELTRKAIALDPNYAHAYALLSELQSQMFWFHYDRSDSVPVAAHAAAQRALELDSSLPDAHFAFAEYLYRVKLNYDGALKELQQALAAAPNDARFTFLLAAVLRRKGDFAGSLAQHERTFGLDPRSSNVAQNLAETYRLMHRYAEAERAYERGLELAPDNIGVVVSAVAMYLNQTGDAGRARRVLQHSTSIDRRSVTYVRLAARLDLFERHPDAVIALLQSAPDTVFPSQFEYTPNSLLLAEAYSLKRDAAAAHTYYARALETADAALQRAPDDPRLHIARSFALVGLGQKPRAIAAALRATALMPIEKEAWRGSNFQIDLALVYARTGEPDKAIDILQKLLSMPSETGRGALRANPAWDALHSHPRFQALIGQPGA